MTLNFFHSLIFNCGIELCVMRITSKKAANVCSCTHKCPAAATLVLDSVSSVGFSITTFRSTTCETRSDLGTVSFGVESCGIKYISLRRQRTHRAALRMCFVLCAFISIHREQLIKEKRALLRAAFFIWLRAAAAVNYNHFPANGWTATRVPGSHTHSEFDADPHLHTLIVAWLRVFLFRCASRAALGH